MNYEDIKKHINIENKNLGNFLTKDEIEWLSKHFKFIYNLLMGRTVREEDKYSKFVDTIKNKKEPKSKQEKIYTNFISYLKTYLKNSKSKKNDSNTLYNGLEIFPDGLRPTGQGVNYNKDRDLDNDPYPFPLDPHDWPDDDDDSWKY
tara:strand:+ start:986 stop:1426 length:441 start_codon:yes stop_codon:yes gene_type:complete